MNDLNMLLPCFRTKMSARRAIAVPPISILLFHEEATTQIFTVREKEKPEELSGVKG